MLITRQCYRFLCKLHLKNFRVSLLSTDSTSSLSSVKSQNQVFDREKERQLKIIKRIEKIKVYHEGPQNQCTLLMNKDLSTPYHVAMHLHTMYTNRSAIALVNGIPQHMLQPLTEDCNIRFVTLKDDNPKEVNHAFWRACAHMMGAVLQDAFKETVTVIPARAPDIPCEAGCFAYDVNLSIKWDPTQQDLITLSRSAYKMSEKKLPFERLVVKKEVAQAIFQDNVYKQNLLENTVEERVTLFRLGEFIDINDGPLVTDTGFMVPSNFSFTAAHHFEDYLLPQHKLTRFQGAALPSDFHTSYVTWNIIEERAKDPVTIDQKPLYKSPPVEELQEEASQS